MFLFILYSLHVNNILKKPRKANRFKYALQLVILHEKIERP